MKADEMFKKLGYEKYDRVYQKAHIDGCLEFGEILYNKSGENGGTEIHLSYKGFRITDWENDMGIYVDRGELLAIVQQYKEMGWLE